MICHLAFAQKERVSIPVVLQILQPHSRPQSLTQSIAGRAGLNLFEDLVQQSLPMGFAHLLPGLAERREFPTLLTKSRIF